MIRSACAAALVAFSAQAAAPAIQWSRWELKIDGDAPAVMAFEGPGGSRLQAPGFRSGGASIYRAAFPVAGTWKWRGGSVRVRPYSGSNPLYRHGFLRVADSRRYLAHADGTPFLWMGDTAWYAGVKATTEEWRDYIADRAAKGFSVVQISAVRGPATAPPAFDSGGQPDDSYWTNIDAKVRYANEHGIVVLLVGLGRPVNPADQARVATPEFARYVAARFNGDHVVYSPNFDGAFEPLFDTVAENLRAATPFHLITQHPNTRQGQNELYVPKPYLDFSGLQSGHHSGRLEQTYGAARDWPRSLWAMTPVKPVINIEGMYDGRGSDDGNGWRAKDVRKIGWISWLSGALGYTYGAGETDRKVPGSNGGVWGWNQDPAAWDHWRKAAAWPSSTHMKVLRDFFASIPWWRLEAAPGMVIEDVASNQERAVAAAAADGSFAVVYTPVRRKLTLDLSGLRRPVSATWVNPLIGERTANASSAGFVPPDSGEDWVLLIAASKKP